MQLRSASVSSNLFHDSGLKRPIVNVKLDNNKVPWLAYAANYIQRVRGLFEVICDWGVVEVQSAQNVPSGLTLCLEVHYSVLARTQMCGKLLDIMRAFAELCFPTSACMYQELQPSRACGSCTDTSHAHIEVKSSPACTPHHLVGQDLFFDAIKYKQNHHQ